jgi:hypothetical protein
MNLFTPAFILFPANIYFFVSAGLAIALPRIDAASHHERDPVLGPTPVLRASPAVAGP